MTASVNSPGISARSSEVSLLEDDLIIVVWGDSYGRGSGWGGGGGVVREKHNHNSTIQLFLTASRVYA